MQLALTAAYWAIQFYILLIFIWAFGSFFPEWRSQSWFRGLGSMVEPYLELYRVMRLQIGMFDLTPMIAVTVLSIICLILRHLSSSVR